MASHVFTPNRDSNKDTSTLSFQTISKDFSSSPFPVDINVGSAIQIGDYVYALSRASGTTDYAIEENLATRVTGIFDSPENQRTTITLDRTLKADVKGDTGFNAEYDYFLIDRNFNKINLAKIGFDRKPAQEVPVEVELSDLQTSQQLVDTSENPLFTNEKKSFENALLGINATSVTVGNDSSNPVKVVEQFPVESEVSSSLLGIPRAEEQLSLFSDVSTLGLDTQHWEYFSYNRPRLKYLAWEERASEEGNRYSAKIIENTMEQALELSANPVPYTYPWDASFSSFYRANQYAKWKRFVFLGNMLYQYFHDRDNPRKDEFLNPKWVRWGDYVGRDGSIDSFYVNPGITEDEAFRLIDKWTVTWIKIEKEEYDLITTNEINNTVLSTAWNATNSNHANLLKDVIGEYDGNNLGVRGYFDQDFDNGDLTSQARADTLKNIYKSFLTETAYNEGGFTETMPGYLSTNDVQSVTLQSKETFRYQPGRISGFTFGSRVDINSNSLANFAEWGCVNESDEYVFQLKGPKFSIVRRSTIRQTEQSLNESGLSLNDETFIPGGPDSISGGTRPDQYEYVYNQEIWNGDPLNGNGRTGYVLDPKTVTMWKIEFSWYGAIGVQFYAYIPVGSGEARWVKMHRIIIENSLPQANLQDPYFKMRYHLNIPDKTVTTDPQFIYKYGSSVYIDGGDEGTKTLKSFTSNEKIVPEDRDAPGDVVPNDDFKPMLALRSKRFISNRDGILRPSRIISLPEKMTVSTNQLIEVDFLECQAAPQFGYTYDNGLKFRDDLSPAIRFINRSRQFQKKDAAQRGDIGTGDTSTIKFPKVDSEGNEFNDYDCTPFASRLVDFVFVPDQDDQYAMTMIEAVKHDGSNSPTEADYSPNHQRLFATLEAADSPMFFRKEDDDAKVDVPGLNNVYIDWAASLQDTVGIPAAKRETNEHGSPLLSRVRLRQIKDVGETEYSDGTVEYLTQYQKLPITASKPLFFINGGSGGRPRNSEVSTMSWTNYKTLANPRLPSSSYATGTSEQALADYDGRVGGVGVGISEEFKRNFGTLYAPNSTPADFYDLTNDNPSNVQYPFRTVQRGRSITQFFNRGTAQNYANGGVVPYSFLAGQARIKRMTAATATIDEGLNGKEIEIRFLNPHESGVGMLRNPFTNGQINQGKYPEFRVGFTNLRPNASEATNIERWDGTFDKSGSAIKMTPNDMIFADYTARRVNSGGIGGEQAFGERTWSNAGALRDDYRLDAILDESHTKSHPSNATLAKSLGYTNSASVSTRLNSGGSFGYVRLKVTPETQKYNNIRAFGNFSQILNSGVLRGGNSNNWKAPDGSDLFTSGEQAASTLILFPNHPDANSDQAISITDFPEFSGSESDFKGLLIYDAEASGFSEIADGLSLEGGEIVIDNAADGTTYSSASGTALNNNPQVISKGVKINYYANDDGLTQAAYTNNQTKTAYLYQINTSLAAADQPYAAELHLNTANAIVLKIVELEYPDGINGTQTISIKKVFGADPTQFFPVIQMRDGAQLNNINIKVTPANGAPRVISPIWKTHGAMQISMPCPNNDSPAFTKLQNLQPAGVQTSIPENFIETDRLSGLEFNEDMNKRLRKSFSNSEFRAGSSDANARKRYRGSNTVLYDLRGKKPERAKRIASFFFGPSEPGISTTSTQSLYSIFGEDRQKILPDDRGAKAIFIRAQMVNNDDGDVTDTAKVKVGVNVAEI